MINRILINLLNSLRKSYKMLGKPHILLLFSNLFDKLNTHVRYLFQFLLHYLKFLKDWFDPYTWETVPVTQTCWSLLRDSYHCPLALRFRPQHIAIAIVYFSLLSLGVEVPYNRQADVPWWKVRLI